MSVFLGGLMIFALAFGYSYSLLSLPFVQANFVLTLLYGLFSGLAFGFALRWYKVRSEQLADNLGFAAGFGAVYLSWVVWVSGHLGVLKATGLLGLLDLASSPVRLWQLLCGVNKMGSWEIWGYKPTGVVLWLLWSLEAALIIGLSSLVSSLVEREVFCEDCGNWCQKQFRVARLRSCDQAELRRHLEAKDFSFLGTLGAPIDGWI
jgi:hypothetical protein